MHKITLIDTKMSQIIPKINQCSIFYLTSSCRRQFCPEVVFCSHHTSAPLFVPVIDLPDAVYAVNGEQDLVNASIFVLSFIILESR